MKQRLMKGNDAVIYGALMGGSTHFFGYPITPASEISHAAALEFRRTGRHFLQAEDEVNAINMLYGSASAGGRVMTASSGPGISLMAEGLSYLAGAELPCVVIDVQRAGPGLGNIWPEQGDYNMVVKGGGHGCYKNIVLVPSSAQEMCDMTYKAFALAEKYRMTVFILSDAYIGQMMEPVSIPSEHLVGPRMDWAVYGDKESRENLISSIYMSAELQGQHNEKLQAKYAKVEEEITDYECINTEDAEVVYVAFGISARICMTAVESLRASGIKAGLLRPKTVFPFPSKIINTLSSQVKKIITVELNNGMMADDVQLASRGNAELLRYNWMGGKIPTTKELINRTLEDIKND